jgi:hypothetical protein
MHTDEETIPLSVCILALLKCSILKGDVILSAAKDLAANAKPAGPGQILRSLKLPQDDGLQRVSAEQEGIGRVC